MDGPALLNPARPQLKRGAFFRNKQMRQIRALKLEELYFIFDPPGIPGQAAVHPDAALTLKHKVLIFL